MSGSFFAFTGPARCEEDYQQACVRSCRVARCRDPADAPSPKSPQLEYLQEEPCRVRELKPMPVTRASGRELNRLANRYYAFVFTHRADPSDNLAGHGTRAPFALYLESREMYAV